MISFSSVSKNFGRIKALKNVSLSADGGDIVGYIGPNGSGKTTTIRILTGLIKPDEGQVTVMGTDVSKGYEKIGRQVSVIFENHGLYPRLTAGENLEFFGRAAGYSGNALKEKVDRYLKEFGLHDRKSSQVKTFSKGMMRRLAIARGLIIEPRILVLDEPFDGVDVQSRHAIIQMLKEWIKEKSHIIFLTSHNMTDLEELATRILILKAGELLASGSYESLCSKDRLDEVEVVMAKPYEMPLLKNIFEADTNIIEYKVEGKKLLIKSQCKDNSYIASKLINGGINFEEITKKRESLSEIYLRMVEG